MDIFSNPEFLRNVRAQLRWGRMVTTAAICAAISLVFGYSFAESAKGSATPHEWGMNLLQTMLLFQVIILTIGGGIACLQSISREKELNTFDFQRVTRLTPMELAMGKLFGAPATTYFAVICLLPAALVGAFVGRARPTFVLAAYVVVFLGSIAFHAFALMTSLQVERHSSVAAIILFLFLVQLTSSVGSIEIFSLGQMNPFYSLDLVKMTTWQMDGRIQGYSMWGGAITNAGDVFFGWRVHHVAVLIVVFLIFTAWFLLATVRNIKRDPSVYELLTPLQALGFALYVNLIVIGFFKWDRVEPMQAHGGLLTLNLLLFFALGLLLMRNRERLRRILRQSGEAGSDWISVSWPAPHLLLGLTLVGAASIAAVHAGRATNALSWDMGLAAFRTAFLALWLVRDVQFLQWMNLRRGRRQALLGVLFLVVFYACASILFAALDMYDTPRRTAIAGMFIPPAIFGMSSSEWLESRSLWMGAAAAQFVLCALFIFLQRQKLRELSAPATAPAPAD